MSRLTAVTLAICLAAPLAGQGLTRKINRLLADRHASRAFWGIQVNDLRTGRILYAQNSQRLFAPASVTKLYTTALALSRLGPAHRMRTTVRAAQRPDANGILHGDLVLVGGGDPSLSGRTIPYDREADRPDGFGGLEELADAVVATGLRRVTGDIIGDDTAYLWEPYPNTWAQEDALYDYGVPVSALVVNDGQIVVRVKPGVEPGDSAAVETEPLPGYLLLQNFVQTVEASRGRINAHRYIGSREIRIDGTTPVRGETWTARLAVDDPALFAAHALRDALIRRGVSIEGRPAARHRHRAEEAGAKELVEIAARESPPLSELIKVVNKVSQNLHAEILLREVARVRRGVGSLDGGADEMRIFLREAGIPADDYFLEDGSGLSRANQVSPQATGLLLGFMLRSPHTRVFFESLPVAGYDGSLQKRFTGRDADRIHAKTGSLRYVTALAGYVENKKRVPLRSFVIFANRYAAASSDIRGLVDKIAVAIAQE